jgi:hypothetical protein
MVMKWLMVQLVHLKVICFGDRQFKKDGFLILPCKKCHEDFKSYPHHNDYDAWCNECVRKYERV